MLLYARKKRYKKAVIQAIQAKDILYAKMIDYDKKAREILHWLIKTTKEADKSQFDRVKQLYQKMKQLDDMVIDCAYKLAPYQSPKRASIEVSGKMEHRYVMRVPQQMKSQEEWMKATGASTLKENDVKREVVKQAVVPSIHDFDEDEDYVEPGMLN